VFAAKAEDANAPLQGDARSGPDLAIIDLSLETAAGIGIYRSVPFAVSL